MSVHDVLRNGIGIAHDTLARLFMPSSTVTLYKVNSSTDAFESVLAVSSKWFFEYLATRNAFVLEIADESGALTTAMASATHVQIDSDYYVINQADTLPPKGMDVTWKIFCTRYEERTHYATL